MSHLIYLGLGSNQGDRLANLAAARAGLSPEIQVLKASPIYETEPWGYKPQPAFLNQALEAQTDLAPLDLLKLVKDLEVRLGRQRTFRNGPRVIDIDILLYDNWIMSLPGLKVPHPRMEERAFVLVPLADLAPDLIHPVYRQTIQELLKKVDRTGVKRLEEDSPFIK